MFYKDKKKKFRTNINHCKVHYYKISIESKKHVHEQQKEDWKIVNNYKGNVQQPSSPSISIDNKLVHDHQIITNAFCRHFTTVLTDKLNKLYSNNAIVSLSPGEITPYTSFISIL